jgi:hypothetical protein
MGFASGDEAKAALLLRADVFERIVTVWRASVRVQTAYRSHRCSRQYDRAAGHSRQRSWRRWRFLVVVKRTRSIERDARARRSMTTRWG